MGPGGAIAHKSWSGFVLLFGVNGEKAAKQGEEEEGGKRGWPTAVMLVPGNLIHSHK